MEGPAMPTMAPMSNEMHYPCLYLEWDDDYKLPDSGMMVVRFKKRSQTDRRTPEGMKQTVELDITEIKDVEADKSEPKEDRGSIMDRYRDEYDEKE